MENKKGVKGNHWFGRQVVGKFRRKVRLGQTDAPMQMQVSEIDLTGVRTNMNKREEISVSDDRWGG